MKIYRCTIVMDRYSGHYSGGVFTAWPLKFSDIPKDIDGCDITCAVFWSNYKGIVGKGDTVTDAYEDLEKQYEKLDN